MSLILTILILIAIFFVGKHYPLIAGVMAVIPVKIVATLIFSFNEGGRESFTESIRGMLAGQFIVGFILLGIYLYIRGTL